MVLESVNTTGTQALKRHLEVTAADYVFAQETWLKADQESDFRRWAAKRG